MSEQVLFNELIVGAKELQKRVKDIYIYGAGYHGKDVYRLLKRKNVDIKGFLVTEDITSKQCLNLPVYLASEKIGEDIGIIIAMTPIYANEVKQFLAERHVDEWRIICSKVYEAAGKDLYAKEPVLDITTAIGCSMNCKFCPQSKLLSKYYENNVDRIKYLTVENFKVMLSNIEKERILVFAGLGEPFLNPDCMELLRVACDSEHRVYLFSTLVGASIADIEELVELPIDLCRLHVADKHKYANIPLTEEYYKKLQIVLAARKKNSEYFVDYANAQGEPDDRVAELCENRLEVMTSVHDRAGNVEEKDAEHIKIQLERTDKIECQCIGTMLDSNAVLPDGTLILCNTDYGMQHVLGNLLQDNMQKIREGYAFKEICSAFNGESDIDLLCRKCTNARKIQGGTKSIV